jgi:dUTP pyrophosphatase
MLSVSDSLKIVRLSANAIIPKQATGDSAGYDLSSLEDVKIMPNSSSLIKTGIAVKIPRGYYGRIASRSGLAVKRNLEVGAGVIDSDYRGEIMILLRNHGNEPQTISARDKCAQLIITKYISPIVEIVDTLDDTERGANGFGSTGV